MLIVCKLTNSTTKNRCIHGLISSLIYDSSISLNLLAPFGLAIFGSIFEKLCCSRVFRIYFEIFLENILGYLRVEEFLEYILRYF